MIYSSITESIVETAALAWLEGLGWRVAHGRDIAPDTPKAERAEYGEVIFQRRLHDSLAGLNPGLPGNAQLDAIRKLTRPEGATLEARNRAFHRMLINGVEIEYRDTQGKCTRGPGPRHRFREHSQQRLACREPVQRDRRPEHQAAGRRAVRQRPALGVIELKKPADEDATIRTAWNQLQTYKAELPTLFAMNEALVVSDGNEARLGTLTAGEEWFQALAHRYRGGACRLSHDRNASDAARRIRAEPLPCSAARLHRVRR